MDFDFYLKIFNYIQNTAKNVLNFLDSDILGYPVIYWLLGSGLIVYLGWRIIQAVTPL